MFHDVYGPQEEENCTHEGKSNDHEDEQAIQIVEEPVISEGETHEEAQVMVPEPQTRQPSGYLRDYYCHTTQEDPIRVHSTHSESSGKSYPITNYINYECYTVTPQVYLAAITSMRNPIRISKL